MSIVGLLSAALYSACSSGEGNGTSGGSYCQTLESRLRACDLISDGRYEGCVDFHDPAERCEVGCLQAANCDGLESFQCSFSGSVARCFRSCIGETEDTPATSKCRNVDERIEFDQLCDQSEDCSDGSDELGCEVVSMCDADREVLAWMYCNGNRDCTDGADEPDGCAVSMCPTSAP